MKLAVTLLRRPLRNYMFWHHWCGWSFNFAGDLPKCCTVGYWSAQRRLCSVFIRCP